MATAKHNVLVTSAGQRVSLIKSFMDELRAIYPDAKVYTADMKPQLSPACHIADKAFKVPAVLCDAYIDTLIRLCIDHDIGLIVPTIDTELLALSEHLARFQQHDIEVSISDVAFIKRCRDKRQTNQLFVENNITIPQQFDIRAGVASLAFPVFVKPCDGSLSKGIFLAQTADDIRPEQLSDEKLMYMEYISPKEYDEFTVDCYYDRQSVLRCVVPRQRLFVRAGEVNKAITRKNIIIEHFFNNIANLAGARGCLTIQVFLHKTNNSIKGIEINPRFGGGYPLTYLSGANYTKWLLEEYMLDKAIATYHDWENNLLMLRYDAEVLVHDNTQR